MASSKSPANSRGWLGWNGKAFRPLGATGVAVAQGRWRALDWFRFLAVLLMVQGHTFYVVLDDSIRGLEWYRWHSYVHGYTAPMFMFASGLAFGITTFRKWESHSRWGKALYKRLERYLMIIAIGYLLHLPSYSFHELANAPQRVLHNFFKVDALQNIGVTLLVCELAVWGLKKRGRFVAFCAAAAVTLVLLAPALWAWDAIAHLPLGLAAYVNDQTRSIFPLAPWAGFIFAGIVVSYGLHQAGRFGRLSDSVPRLVAASGMCLLGTLLAQNLDWSFLGTHSFWKTGPMFFVWRLGVVLLLLAALCAFERVLPQMGSSAKQVKGVTQPQRGWPWTVQVLGQETLVIYVVHLLVLYGSPLNPSIHLHVGRTQDLLSSILIFLSLFCGLILFTLGWHHFKTQKPKLFQTFRWTLTTALALYILTSSLGLFALTT